MIARASYPTAFVSSQHVGTASVSNGNTTTGLILNLKNVAMCYKKYERDIVTKHKVELVGWPATIKFANPSDIGTVEDIRKLRQALKVGECKWIVQSRGQQAAYAEVLARKVAAGEQVAKKRKERSDKGKPRAKGGTKAAQASKSGQSSKRGTQGKKHTGDKVGEPSVSEDDDDSGDNEIPKQPPRKKRKYTAAGKARAEKKLPPALKSKFIVNTDDEDDDTE